MERNSRGIFHFSVFMGVHIILPIRYPSCIIICSHHFDHVVVLQVNELQENDGEAIEQGSIASSSSSQRDLSSSSSSTSMASQGVGLTIKRMPSDSGGAAGESKRQKVQAQVADPLWPLEKQYVDSIINFLIR